MNQITDLNNKIKIAQEKYASALSKNESIKTETIKRKERIKSIENEIQNWKNLRFNSEKMSKELNSRINKLNTDIENIIKLPEIIAVKKGQLMQNTSNTENEKNNSSVNLNSAEKEYDEINKKLKIVEQKMMLARENKARSGATLEGLENRKKDLINNLKNDLNISEKNLKDFSDLKNSENFPNVVEQEDKLDAKKKSKRKTWICKPEGR